MSENKLADSISYVKAALLWQYNLIVLSAAVLFALIARDPTALVLALGFELMYLSIVPQNKRFQRLVRSWQYEEEKRQNEIKLRAMFLELPPEMRARCTALGALCRNIRENYGRLSSTSRIFVKQTDERLEGLLQGYLRLLHTAHQHREYLRSTDPASIKSEIVQLQRALASDSPKVQEINQKRVEILNKRLEKFAKVRENTEVIDAQCAAMEDVLQLIRDQSVTLRDPQRISDQLDELVHDVEHTEQTVREVEAIFDMASPDLTGTLPPVPEALPLPPDMRQRNRIGN
jgi:hypothetical protein